MSRLANELKELGDILTHLDMEHARDVAGAYNRRLAGLLEDALIIARLYWREQSEGGGSLLKPITFTKGESHDDVSDPQQFVIPSGEPDGIISWSFRHEEVVWAEGLDGPSKDVEVLEPAAFPKTSHKYLVSNYKPSSILVFPLRDQGFVVGVYCLDIARSDLVTKELFKELQSVRRALGKFLVFAHQEKQKAEAADRAVKNFLDKVREISLPRTLLQPPTEHRRAFFARPFTPEFSELETRITETLNEIGVDAQSYRPTGDGKTVVDGVISQVDDAHFGIADITGANPNVLAEVGMMFMVNKPVMLLRSRNDQDPIPFDLAHRYVYEYTFEAATNTFSAHPKGERDPRPFAECLREFVKDLEADDRFRNSPPYKPSKKSSTRTTRKTKKKTSANPTRRKRTRAEE